MRKFAVVWAALAVVACGRRNFNVDADLPDEAPRECDTPPPNCPGAQIYACNGKCYVACDTTVSRPAGAVVCRGWGGCLADPGSVPDNDCAASKAPGDSWIAPQQSSGATAADEGWLRCDGTAVQFTAWRTGSPDDMMLEDGQEQCALTSPGGAWDDRDCSELHKFICERPL